MQDSQYLHFLFADLVHRRERARQHEFASASDASGTTSVWKRAEVLNGSQHIQRNPPRYLRSVSSNIIADPLEIVGSVRRSADAQPR